MKSFTILSVFASLVASASAVFTVNTPANLVQCLPALVSWMDGTAPFYPSVIPGGQVSAAALKTFDTTSSNQLTWKVDIPSGQSVTIEVRDSTGAIVYSDAVTIQSGSDSSCLSSHAGGTSSTTSGASATSGATSAAGSSSSSGSGSSTGSAAGASSSATSSSSSMSASSRAAAAPSNSASSGVSSTSSTRSSTSAGSSSSSTESNGAMHGSSMNAVGLAGLLGLVGAALL